MERPDHIHLEPTGGIAGDMFAAAMVDALPWLEARIAADLGRVLPAGVTARFLKRDAAGIMARGFEVRAMPLRLPEVAGHHHHHGHGHHHHHGDGHHHHGDHDHFHADPGLDTTHAGLQARIAAAGLDPLTARHAGAILRVLGEAEAQIHGTTLDAVHFHELADWDSLADVVAAGAIAAALDGATFSVAPLPLGGGTVRTAHGLLPVPAPATARILQGFEMVDDGVAGERVTPTGAAILRHLAGAARPARARLLATGYGAGTRKLPGIPNVLRATLMSSQAAASTDRVLRLACDLDDMTGEEIGTACAILRDMAGVADLVTLNLMGKKGRPAVRLELLVRPEAAEAVADAIFAQTTTLGLRQEEVTRRLLERAPSQAQGMPAKTAARPGGATVKIEAEALAGLPTLAQRRAAQAAADRKGGASGTADREGGAGGTADRKGGIGHEGEA